MANDGSSTDLEVTEIIAAAEALKIRTEVKNDTRQAEAGVSYRWMPDEGHIKPRETITLTNELEPSGVQNLHGASSSSSSHWGTNRAVRGRGRRIPCQPEPGQLGSDRNLDGGSIREREVERVAPRAFRGTGPATITPRTSWFEDVQQQRFPTRSNPYSYLETGRQVSGPSEACGETFGSSTKEAVEGEIIRESMAEVLEVNRKPREVYIPDAPLEGEALFNDRLSKRYRTGLNFAAYDRIPVQITSGGEEIPQFDVQCFSDLNLHDRILENISRLGYHVPTPIQKNASAYIMERKDVMACAQTGSGKTAGYLLPIIHALLEQDLSCITINEPQVLILCPTRELSSQILKEAIMYSDGTQVISRSVYGGVSLVYQRNYINTRYNILIATPGRLIQFLDEKTIRLHKVEYFVLDEADRMLEMGFMTDVRRIVGCIPPKDKRVSAMFSATFPHAIQKAAGDYLNDYVFIAVGTVGGACNDIQQIIHKVERADKRRKLLEVFQSIKPGEKVLIFCAKKQGADFLAAHLSQLGISTTSLHGDRLQSQRELALKEFTEGTREVLVATAVAARGLDIPKVSFVVNYDLPDNIDEYVHRIGRTGRVGNLGKAISFYEESMDEQLKPKLLDVLRGANQEIPPWMLEEQGAGYNHIYRRRFGATDRRSGARAFNSVPDPVETEEDGWG